MLRTPASLLVDQQGNIIGVVNKEGNYRLLTETTMSGLMGIDPTQTGGLALDTTLQGLHATASGIESAVATETTLSSLNTKDFATETTQSGIYDINLSIKDTDGIKKITDALPAGTNTIGSIKLTDGTETADITTLSGINRLDTRTVLVNGDGSKDVSVIEDATNSYHSRLLTETDFKPGITLSVSQGAAVENPASVFKERLQNGGSDDMRVDGSSVPVEFAVNADSTYDTTLNSLRIVMIANTISVADTKFGPISNLTNGILVQIRSNDVTTTISTLKYTVDFFDFHGPSTQPIDRSGSKDALVVQHNFGNTKLIAGSSDFVKITVQDDLSSAQFNWFFASVAGVRD